jgi:hypothetical protein
MVCLSFFKVSPEWLLCPFLKSLLCCQIVLKEKSTIYGDHYRMEPEKHLCMIGFLIVCLCFYSKIKISWNKEKVANLRPYFPSPSALCAAGTRWQWWPGTWNHKGQDNCSSRFPTAWFLPQLNEDFILTVSEGLEKMPSIIPSLNYIKTIKR